MYVQLEGGQRCAVMAPVHLECTVGLSAATDSSSLLSLVVHANMPELKLTLGHRQVGVALFLSFLYTLAIVDAVYPERHFR